MTTEQELDHAIETIERLQRENDFLKETLKVGDAIDAAAQLWCRPQHAKKTMDPDLALDIANLITKFRQEEKRVIADYVEKSKRFDNCSLARDIREGKYVEKIGR